MVMKVNAFSVPSACLTIDVCCHSWTADCNKTKEQQELELHFLKGNKRAAKQLHFGLEILKVSNPHLQTVELFFLLEALLQQCYVLTLSWLRLNMFRNSMYVCSGNGDR